jgi:hypothetical protein
MKITKKMRKKANGMNAVTAIHFKKGTSAPRFINVSPLGNVPEYQKVAKGVPFVNSKNFN